MGHNSPFRTAYTVRSYGTRRCWSVAPGLDGGFFPIALADEAGQVPTVRRLATQGITLIFIDEEDIMEAPEPFVRDALRYMDRSRLGGRS